MSLKSSNYTYNLPQSMIRKDTTSNFTSKIHITNLHKRSPLVTPSINYTYISITRERMSLSQPSSTLAHDFCFLSKLLLLLSTAEAAANSIILS